MAETIELTDEAVEIALAWDRLHNAMETEVLVYAGFDGKAWMVAATKNNSMGQSSKSTLLKEYEPTFPDALNALAETLENLPTVVDATGRNRGH